MAKTVSKKLRFEVFKRDKFTCQYCGKKAPDVVLHADHIEPKSKGGKNTAINLITACSTCNLGKGARRLSDGSVVEKQRKQIEELQEKQEQLAMMVEWQRSLLDLDSQSLDEVADFWETICADTVRLTESGRKELRKLISRHGVGAVMSAMRAAGESYIKVGDDGSPTRQSVDEAYGKIGAICRVREAEKERPWLKEVFYIRGIIRNRFNYVNTHEAKRILELAFTRGGDASELRAIALEERNWTEWSAAMHDYIEDLAEVKDG